MNIINGVNRLLKLEGESDIFLTNEVKAGNEEAFNILIERYGHIIAYNISSIYLSYGFLKRSDREDLYQECCIVLYKAAKYYDLMKNVKFSTYANVCVKNYLISFLRRYCRTNCESVSFEDVPENEFCKYDRYFIIKDPSDFISFVSPGILTSFESKVLMMYIERKSYKYIAKILNKSIKSIDNAVYRIKTKLKPYAESFTSD